MHKSGKMPLPNSEVLKIGVEITKGLNWLHQKGELELVLIVCLFVFLFLG